MAEQRRVGAYQILSRLGAGGMAETFVAERRGPGDFTQRVCLKRIRADSASDPELVRQFLSEAALLARLRHAAITQVIDFGLDQGDYYLALELVDGVDLRELIESQPTGLPAELVHYIAIELATALDFAHRAGGDTSTGPIVHRDVSTSNVLLSGEGEVKLSDFGIARALGAPKHTQTGIVRGKVSYLAPEYARSGRCDERCDLFALGVVLYECVCGERPHDGATELETLERAAHAERTPLAALAPQAPAPLLALIEELLEPEPELRTQSAASVLEALIAMPSSARARRELGQLVRKAQANRPAPKPLVLGADPVAKTEPYGPARDDESVHSPSQTAAKVTFGGLQLRVGRKPISVLLAALLIAIVVAGVAISRRDASASAATSEPPAASASDDASKHEQTRQAQPAQAQLARPQLAQAQPATIGAASPSSNLEGAPSPSSAHPTPTTSTNSDRSMPAANLTVVVLPFGRITIDGREVGADRVSMSLPPGEHAISARNNDRSFERKVTLVAAEHRRIVLH